MSLCLLVAILACGCGGAGNGADGDGDGADEPAAEDQASGEEARDGEDQAVDPAPDGQDAPRDPAEEGALPLAALYDDTASVSAGAWPEGLDMLEALLNDSGFACERITRPMLNDGSFELSRFTAVVFGGGFAYPGYTVLITEEAKARLRAYVESGGLFMGVCAGAFFACDRVRWEGALYDDESGYTLDLLSGVCTGPIESLSVYPEWALADVGFLAHPALEGFDDAPFTRTLWYGAGPAFEPDDGAVETVATYESEGLPERGEAALVTFSLGAGHVILWGPHPEVPWEGVSPDAWRLAGLLMHWASDPP